MIIEVMICRTQAGHKDSQGDGSYNSETKEVVVLQSKTLRSQRMFDGKNKPQSTH